MTNLTTQNNSLSLPSEIDTSLVKMEDILAAHRPGIALYKKEHGEQQLMQVISRLIEQTQAALNVQKNISPSQIIRAAHEIVRDYYYFSFEDIRGALLGALKSRQFYGKFDFNDVMNIMYEWSEERFKEAERISMSKHAATKEVNPHRLSASEAESRAARELAISKDSIEFNKKHRETGE